MHASWNFCRQIKTCCLLLVCSQVLGAALVLSAVGQESKAPQIIVAERPVDGWLDQDPNTQPSPSDKQDQKPMTMPPYDPELPIMDLSVDVRNHGLLRPTDESPEFLARYADLPFPRPMHLRAAMWRAPDIRYQPLYFEDVALERYGQTHRPLVQPWSSGAHFFASFVSLPYNLYFDLPCSCTYPLGFCRPGSPAPSTRQHWFWHHRTR